MHIIIAKSYYLQYVGSAQIKVILTLALVAIGWSIEANQGGTVSARTRISLGSHTVFFMVLLGLLNVRSMAQALWLPFEYY